MYAGKTIENDGCQATLQIHLDWVNVYTPVDGVILQCDDSDGPNPFRFTTKDGNLVLKDRSATYEHYALCQIFLHSAVL